MFNSVLSEHHAIFCADFIKIMLEKRKLRNLYVRIKILIFYQIISCELYRLLILYYPQHLTKLLMYKIKWPFSSKYSDTFDQYCLYSIFIIALKRLIKIWNLKVWLLFGCFESNYCTTGLNAIKNLLGLCS